MFCSNQFKLIALVLAGIVMPTLAMRDLTRELFEAAKHGHTDTINALIETGANPNDRTTFDEVSPLHYAAQYDRAAAINALINARANLNCTNRHRSTPLHIAAQYNSAAAINALINAGANLNCTNRHGSTPLHIAAQYGNAAAITALIKAGANLNCTNIHESTPLHIAAQYGNAEAIRILLKADAKPNQRDSSKQTKPYDTPAIRIRIESCPRCLDRRGKTPLHIAMHFNNTDAICALLQGGACPDCMDSNGKTPLHIAVQKNNTDAINALLQVGVNPNRTDYNEETPLHIAVFYGHTDAINALLKAGANPNYNNKKIIFTPLCLAASINGNCVAVRMFLEAEPVETNFMNHVGASLHYAMLSNDPEIIKTLLKAGANPNFPYHNGGTPLHTLISCNRNEESVRMLLNAGADPNCERNDGKTPLHIAAMQGATKIIRVLLEAGVDPNHTTHNGETPLHIAARNSNADAVRILLQAEVDLPKGDKPFVMQVCQPHQPRELFQEAHGRPVRGRQGMGQANRPACGLLAFAPIWPR